MNTFDLEKMLMDLAENCKRITKYVVKIKEPFKANQWLRPIFKLSYPGDMFVMAWHLIPDTTIHGLVYTKKSQSCKKQIKAFPTDEDTPWRHTPSGEEYLDTCVGTTITFNKLKCAQGLDFEFDFHHDFLYITVTLQDRESTHPDIQLFRKYGIMGIVSLGGTIEHIETTDTPTLKFVQQPVNPLIPKDARVLHSCKKGIVLREYFGPFQENQCKIYLTNDGEWEVYNDPELAQKLQDEDIKLIPITSNNYCSNGCRVDPHLLVLGDLLREKIRACRYCRSLDTTRRFYLPDNQGYLKLTKKFSNIDEREIWQHNGLEYPVNCSGMWCDNCGRSFYDPTDYIETESTPTVDSPYREIEVHLKSSGVTNA